MISIFRNSKIKAAFSAFFFAVQFSSCSKFVTVDPPVTSTTGASAYTADGTAIAVLTGLYIYLSQGSFITGSGSFSLIGGLSADEWTLSNTVPSTDPMTYFYTNGLFVNTTTDVLGKGDYWGPIYSYIFICNSAIEGINSASTLTPAVKQQLLGEAKFLRAFFNFYLVNFYGDVPLALSTDYKANAILSRTDKAQVFQQIIADLKDAEGLLSPSYLDGTLLSSSTDRVRPTEWAAHALLAKVYLFSGSYDSAASQASLVINNSGLFGLDTLNAVFLKNSTEAIWQLQPVEAGWNTLDAQVFLLKGSPSYNNPVYLSSSIMNEFEPGDERRTDWVDSVIVDTTYYFPYKYKSANYGDPVSEYFMVLRLGEQYLIRAEAEANLNDITDAANDLNTIRLRAGLLPTTANTKSAMLQAILHERKVELFTEMGNRWLDLKRTNSVDLVMTIQTPIKANGSPWQSYQQLYPLPADQVLKDVNLVQNAGY